MPPKKKSKTAVANSNGKSGIDEIRVRLKWASSDHLDTIYVNHMNIVQSSNEFFITFGELIPPVVLDASEAPKEVEIYPKVRLALSKDAMESVVRAINDNYRRYIERAKK